MKKRSDDLVDLTLDEFNERLDKQVLSRLDKESKTKVLTALAVAIKAHAGQVRDDGTPYLSHPLRVALYLAEDFDVWEPDLLCAALLHDALEDEQYLTAARIYADFGERVGHIVQALTKPRDPAMSRIEINQIYFGRLADANDDCKLVKLADKLDNVRDAVNAPDFAKQQRTAAEAKDFYLSLAASLSDATRRQTILELLNRAIERLEGLATIA